MPIDMAECHYNGGKKPPAAELYTGGGLKRASNASYKDLEFSKGSNMGGHHNADATGAASYSHAGFTSRNGPGVGNDGSKSTASGFASSQYSNQNSGLYVGGGGGKLSDSTVDPYKQNSSETARSVAPKANGVANADASHTGLYSNGGNPYQDVNRGSKDTNTSAQASANNTRGIGNIVGGRSSTKSNSGSQSSSRGSSSLSRDSGEFNNAPFINRGASSTPKHSGEFSTGSNGHGSNSSHSSPRTSGELGVSSRILVGKSSTHNSPKASPDSSSGSSKGGSTPRSSFEGNSGLGRIHVGPGGSKGGRSTSGSPPRACPPNIPVMGNVYKGGGANVANGRSNGKLDIPMGNILNPNHGLAGNGNILNSNNSKGSAKCDPANADPMNEATLFKRGLSISNPEDIKNIGNELYRRSNFAEALCLYERAISFSPGQASYRSNRAAALTGLGRYPEAVQECEEAIKLDPLYARAHNRAASLYLKLGLVERSKMHFQAAGQLTNATDLQRVEDVKKHISKCIEMRKESNWKSVIRESDAAISAGAESAPQVLGYKAEALLKLHHPEEASTVLCKAEKVEGGLTKLGIIPPDTFLFLIRVQVEMALGRFEEAVAAAESVVRVDPRKADVLRKARAVCNARSSGNDLFKAKRYYEACAAYGEGLESDPLNAVLLCNRAACRAKIGQFEKALEDCNAALDVQPKYTKALMRRADCYVKLERWGPAANDYEALLKEIPGDLEVIRGLTEAQIGLKKSENDDMYRVRFRGDMMEVSNNDQLQEAVALPGLVVVQYVAKWNDQCREISPFVDGLCKRYPSVNFVKVDVEENPYLAKMERVDFVPTFKLYKNGMTMKEMHGSCQQALEYAVQNFSL